MTTRSKYGFKTKILDESLFDDMAPDEVEDVDNDVKTEYDTEMFIHSVSHYPIEYLSRCLPVLTDKSAVGKEDKNHCTGFSFDRSGLRMNDLFKFVAAAFCMANCEKTRLGATKDFGLTVERKNFGLWITTRKPFRELFGMFSGNRADETELLKTLVRILHAQMHASGKLDKFGDVFYVKWNRGRKMTAFITDGYEKFVEIEPYEYIYKFDGGMAIVKDENTRWNMIDSDGKLLGEWFLNGNHSSNSFEKNEYVPCEISLHEWNFINKKREFLLNKPLNAKTVFEFGESGYAKVERGNSLYNFVDKNGKFVMKRWAFYTGDISDGFVVIRRGEYAQRNVEYNYARVPDGSLLFDEWKPGANSFKDGRAIVRKDGRVAFVNGIYTREPDYNMVGTDGELVFKRRWYDWIWESKYGYNVVKWGEEYNMADKNGKFMLEWTKEVHICTERIVQTCTSKVHSIKNLHLFDMKNGMEEICRGEFMAEYEEAGFICVQTAGDRWNLFRYDGSKLFVSGLPLRFSVPVFRDGLFFTSNGLDCIRFDTDGNMVLYV